MRKLTRAFLFGMAVSTFALTGCKSTDACQDCQDPAACTGCEDPASCEKCSGAAAATMGASNGTCPVSGEPVDANVKTVSFQGKEIGFCCAGCAGKFSKMSDAEKSTLLGG
jgi:hypothetical protein